MFADKYIMIQPSDFPKEQNIKRIDTKHSKTRSGTHGWQVVFHLADKWATKLFSDSKYGGMANAFNEARNFRDSFLVDWDAMRSKRRPPKHPVDMPKVRGVIFVKGSKKATSDEHSSYWHAGWTTPEKKKEFKNFFVVTHGYEKAYQLAVKARREATGESPVPIHSSAIFTIPENHSVKLWRYLDFTKFISMLEKQNLFFVFVGHLNDPFEGSISAMNQAMRRSLSNKKFFDDPINRLELRSRVAVNSWHMNTHESAAMWKLYAKTNEAVCIQSTYTLLRDALPPLFKISTVKYVDYTSNYIPEYHPLAPFVFKRKSFEHEQELRALIDMEEADSRLNSFLGIETSDFGIYKTISIGKVIERVYVAPESPDWFFDLVKRVCVT